MVGRLPVLRCCRGMELAESLAQSTVPVSGNPGTEPVTPGVMGGIVFFTVMAIIAIGAIVLYLRYRPRSPQGGAGQMEPTAGADR